MAKQGRRKASEGGWSDAKAYRCRVIRVDSDLGVELPKAIVDELGLTDGSVVTLQAVAGRRIAVSTERRERRRRYTTADLLKGGSPSRHGEVDWGPPVGKEVW